MYHGKALTTHCQNFSEPLNPRNVYIYCVRNRKPDLTEEALLLIFSQNSLFLCPNGFYMASIFCHQLKYEGSVYYHQDKIHLNQHGKNHRIAHKVTFQEVQT